MDSLNILELLNDYSFVSTFFNFLDHCSLIKFGLTCQKCFELAKDHLTSKIVCPIYCVTDALISFRSDFKIEEVQWEIDSESFFYRKKGVFVKLILSDDNKLVVKIKSIFGKVIELSLFHVLSDELADIRPKFIKLNSFQKEVMIVSKGFRACCLIDFTLPWSPTTITLCYNFQKLINFSHSFGYLIGISEYKPTVSNQLTDNIYQKFNLKNIHFSQNWNLMNTQYCCYDYFFDHFNLYQIDKTEIKIIHLEGISFHCVDTDYSILLDRFLFRIYLDLVNINDIYSKKFFTISNVRTTFYVGSNLQFFQLRDKSTIFIDLKNMERVSNEKLNELIQLLKSHFNLETLDDKSITLVKIETNELRTFNLIDQ